MIPTQYSILKENPQILTYPSKTFKLNRDEERILGRTDGVEAVAQTIHMMLTTESNKYEIYPDGFGIVTEDLYGKNWHYVEIQLENRIRSSLQSDERITGMSDYKIEWDKGKCIVSFTAHTIYGDAQVDETITIQEG